MATEESAPMHGACLCGAVKFELTPPSLFCGHCHCSMCRRNHGAAYVTWLVAEKAQLNILQGEDLLTVYQSSSKGQRAFCGKCGSTLFCEIYERPNEVDIPLANMDGPVDLDPQFHVFSDDAVSWSCPADDLPRLGGETGQEPLDG